jgi:Ankyrin repeats (many copies)
MNRSFPAILTRLGYFFSGSTFLLMVRLVWEQTFLTWERGLQMVGFSLMHSPLGIVAVLSFFGGAMWFVVTLGTMLYRKSVGGVRTATSLVLFALSFGLLSCSYGFWLRNFAEKLTVTQQKDAFFHGVYTNDPTTTEAFVRRGVDINFQTSNGAGLHGAAENGYLEVVSKLIALGADVNLLDGQGKTPLDRAKLAKTNGSAMHSLILNAGGKEFSGSQDQDEIARSALEAHFKSDGNSYKIDPKVDIHDVLEKRKK